MIVPLSRSERFNAMITKFVQISMRFFTLAQEELPMQYRLVVSNPVTNQSSETFFNNIKDAVHFVNLHFDYQCNCFLYREQTKDSMNPTFIRLHYQNNSQI